MAYSLAPQPGRAASAPMEKSATGVTMRIVLSIMMLIATSSAPAQQKVTRLQCDGKYSNFLTGYRDVVDRGGYVEIQETTVKVVSVIGFEGTYTVHSANEARVCFTHPEDKLILGCLNRFTGQLQLNQQSKKPRPGDFGGFDQLWDGKCSPARPMF